MCNFILFCSLKTHSEILTCSRNLFQLKNWEERAKASSMQEPEAWAAEGRELDRWLYLDLSAGFDRQIHRKPSYFPTYSPVLKPGQEKIASRTALDLKQFQTLFTVFKLRLKADFPPGWGALSRTMRGGTNRTPDGSQGRNRSRRAFPTATVIAGDKAG